MAARGSTLAVVVAALMVVTACASRPPGPTPAGNSVDQQRKSAPPAPTTPGTSSGVSGVTVPPAGTVAASAASAGPGTRVRATPTNRPSSNLDLDPQAGATIHLDQSHDGALVALRVGQHLLLTLAGSWTPPRASTPLRANASRGYPDSPPAMAHFSAVAVGTARVTAVTDAACFHTTPRCLMAQRMFGVTVHVLPQRSQ